MIRHILASQPVRITTSRSVKNASTEIKKGDTFVFSKGAGAWKAIVTSVDSKMVHFRIEDKRTGADSLNGDSDSKPRNEFLGLYSKEN